MDMVLKLAALAVVGVLAAAALRRSVPEMSIAVTLITQLAMIAVAAGIIGVVVDFLRELATAAGISDELLTPLLKTVGVSIVTKLACDTCRDGGSAALASYIELIGGAVAICFCMPLMMEVLRIITT